VLRQPGWSPTPVLVACDDGRVPGDAPSGDDKGVVQQRTGNAGRACQSRRGTTTGVPQEERRPGCRRRNDHWDPRGGTRTDRERAVTTDEGKPLSTHRLDLDHPDNAA
jgi:hypothetical protein